MNGRRSDRRGYDKFNYDLHVSRVKEAKGTVDCKPPRPHPLSGKGDMEQRRRHAAIEYDNKLLLERLATIVQAKTIDNQIDESTTSHAMFKREQAKSKKRLEMTKITDENQRMLRRIQEVPPAYNHVEWEEHAKANERFKRSITFYPEYYGKHDREQPLSATSGNKSNSHSPSRSAGFSDFNILPDRTVENSNSSDHSPGFSTGN